MCVCISYTIISKKIRHDVSVNHLTTHHLPLMFHRGTLILVNLQQQRNAWHNRKLLHCTKASKFKVFIPHIHGHSARMTWECWHYMGSPQHGGLHCEKQKAYTCTEQVLQ